MALRLVILESESVLRESDIHTWCQVGASVRGGLICRSGKTSWLRHPQEGLYTGRVENNPAQKKRQIVPTASAILDDGTLVEMAFHPKQRRTLFAIYSAGRWTLQDGLDLGSDARLVPFSPNNNLVKNEVVLLPSEPMIYGSEEKLV